MIFKKKYKRSEWMEGLLWAEGLKIDRGWSDTLIKDRARICMQRVGQLNVYFPDNKQEGVMDYLEYYENNLK